MRIWVTRDEPPNGPLSSALRAAGLIVVQEPVLQRRVVDDCGEVVGTLSRDDWLVLTSPYAVDAIAAGPSRKPRVAVVGEASRQAALARGFRVEMVSASGGGAGLWDELRRVARRGRICFPRSSLARPPEAWDQVNLICPVLYETTARAFDQAVVERVDMIAVASPSAVEAIRGAGGTQSPAWQAARARPFASIGPTTSNALRKYGQDVAVEAPERSFPSLAEAIASYAKTRAERPG